MKYETPEMKASTPAINAVQGSAGPNKISSGVFDTDDNNELGPGYADWE